MARPILCDGCRRQITDENPLVAKVYLTPVNGGRQQSVSNAYTAHMDIGRCCFPRVNELGKWQKRKKRVRAA